MSLREQVIQRVYDECADFAERAGLAQGVEPLIAEWIWNMLAGDWKEGQFPVFVLLRDGHRVLWKSEELLEGGQILHVTDLWEWEGMHVR